MGKSVFDRKWHRSTLWALRNSVTEKENEFLDEMGWKCSTIADLGLATGMILWSKTINGIRCMCDRATALAVAHAEMFDKGPTYGTQTQAPERHTALRPSDMSRCGEQPDDSTQPTPQESATQAGGKDQVLRNEV
jgi:hypothetical protein